MPVQPLILPKPFSDFLKDAHKLESLDLFTNRITDIEVLKHDKNIVELNIGRNQVRDIECLKDMKNLEIGRAHV